jgi:hypothetical protein
LTELKRTLEILVPLAFLAVAIEAIVAIPARALNLALDRHDASIYLPGLLLAVVAIVAGRYGRDKVSGLALRIGLLAESLPARTWALSVVGIGIGLRVSWALLFPVDPSSDALTYVNLARGLLEHGTYESDGTFAYWPPGYPFFLLTPLAFIESTRAAILAANLVLFLLSMLLLTQIGALAARPAAGRLAGLLIACWPSVWMGAGIAQKEQLLIPVLLAILLFFEIGMDGSRPGRRMVALAGTGLLLGYATLIQPSLQLLLTVLICRTILDDAPLKTKLASLSLVAIVATLAIGAWTVRNYQVFNSFVLVSTNGGSVLYRANNPLATGGYTSEGEVSLKGISELDANAKGLALGKAWILGNPSAFFRLAAWKQVLFLGDDSTGAFESLRRGVHGSPNVVFVVAKAASNFFWLAVWLVCVIFLAARVLPTKPYPPVVLGLMLGFLYLYTLHSVFESSGRYHLPVLGLLAVLCSYLVSTSASTPGPRGASGNLNKGQPG